VVHRALVLLLSAVLLVGAAGCGSKNKSSSSQSSQSANGGSASQSTSGAQAPAGNGARLAKTRFALHAGLAFGAFHRYIYKPFRAGRFTGPHRVSGLVKAGAAALFAFHESRVALSFARQSPALRRLVAPLTALGNRLQALAASLRARRLNPAQVGAANQQTTSLGPLSSAAGAPVRDQPTPSLGAAP